MLRRIIGLVIMITCLTALVLWPGPASATAPAKRNMALCWDAAIAAADKHGVPREIMLAITLVETRTKREGQTGPWPWTVNVAGKGAWLDSRAQALLHAQRALARGQTSFDVGCFQLNYRWHGEHFASIDHMFEPGPSGDYAARFVKSLHAETGDWIKASGLYHSRTPKHATRYRGLVQRTVTRMNGKAPEPTGLSPPTDLATAGDQRVLRVAGTTVAWPLQSLARVRTPTSAPQSAGAIGLGALRRARGGLLIAGQRPADG